MSIKITFPDQSEKEFAKGISALEVAKSISERLAKEVVVAKINGNLKDLDYKINDNSSIEFLKFSSIEGKQVYWHSSAHVLAQAVKEIFPEVKVAIGPAIENGFYYDFEKETAFSEEEILQIENKMQEIISADKSFCRKEINVCEGLKTFENEPYKIELLQAIDSLQTISLYSQGSFVDLCRGPHLLSTGKIGKVKLLKTSGAYWRGDEKNKMLQRIYGISFPTQKELNQYLDFLEEAKKRDHRKIGKDLDLFSMNDEIGGGLVLWHPKGAMMRKIIEDFWKEEHLKNDYFLVNTPHIGKSNLWETSGHLGFYKENMYSAIEIENQNYYLKPMNCPFHLQIFNSKKRSYKELPYKIAEMGTVYRFERSGQLHGLMRVRGFTQDDAHIICRKEQIEDEVEKILKFSFYVFKAFGFNNFEVFLSTRPAKAVGEEKDWLIAEKSLEKALKNQEICYQVDEGGGAFYGPKIDIKVKDAIGRSWQCTTIQFDFNLPERFDISYVSPENTLQRPFVVHRALFGSLERFFGILIEHYGGDFPLWLAPLQIKIIPINDDCLDYANQIYKEFKEKNFRVEIDTKSEKVGYKIRDAELMKIPYMFIIGEKEKETQSVSVRKRKKGDLGTFKKEEILNNLLKEIENKE